MRELLIATGNPHKFEEIGDEFRELGITPVSLDDIGIRLERPEAGSTYHENARIKAEEAYEKTTVESLADDSGLEVDALDGAPGVRSDRWAGDDATAEDKNNFLLEKLEGVSLEDRTARYVCEMVLVDGTGERLRSRGVCEGRIALEPSGEEGFGYDPIFQVEQRNWETFGSLPAEVKGWISHRAVALNEMISLMKDQDLLPDHEGVNPSDQP